MSRVENVEWGVSCQSKCRYFVGLGRLVAFTITDWAFTFTENGQVDVQSLRKMGVNGAFRQCFSRTGANVCFSEQVKAPTPIGSHPSPVRGWTGQGGGWPCRDGILRRISRDGRIV